MSFHAWRSLFGVGNFQWNVLLLTWANSFSISPALITNGPRTAYSMVMKFGLMLSSWRHFVDILQLLWLYELLLFIELVTAAKMRLFFCGDDKARPTVLVDVKTLTKRLISGRNENGKQWLEKLFFCIVVYIFD